MADLIASTARSPLKAIWHTGCLWVFLTACQHPEPVVRPAFYHWRTELALAPAEQVWLDTLGADRLYVKFFDIGWDAGRGMATPRAVLQRSEPLPAGVEIVPAVFMTNRTFQE
ncbi:MAG: hypothetical protein KDC54_20880, partial [Lewinella sp.]|nr:hypothetical protein [Lewinella sp.]